MYQSRSRVALLTSATSATSATSVAMASIFVACSSTGSGDPAVGASGGLAPAILHPDARERARLRDARGLRYHDDVDRVPRGRLGARDDRDAEVKAPVISAR